MNWENSNRNERSKMLHAGSEGGSKFTNWDSSTPVCAALEPFTFSARKISHNDYSCCRQSTRANLTPDNRYQTVTNSFYYSATKHKEPQSIAG